MDKSALVRGILFRLEAELRLSLAAAHDAKAEATDEESSQEGKYDMRAQSAAYLAEGQARYAAELQEAIAGYRAMPLKQAAPDGKVGVGSVVVLQSGEKKNAYFLGPSRGGLEIEVAGEAFTVITPASPVGRLFFGRRKGDTITLPGQKEPWTIASVE